MTLHRDLILTGEEQAAGKVMMICCSGSESEAGSRPLGNLRAAGCGVLLEGSCYRYASLR